MVSCVVDRVVDSHQDSMPFNVTTAFAVTGGVRAVVVVVYRHIFFSSVMPILQAIKSNGG